MTDTMTSQNIDLSSWDTLYMISRQPFILHVGAQVGCFQKKIADCWVDSFENAAI